jgi:hypothetical protein
MGTEIENEKSYPELIRSFLNYFWVSLPKEWEIETKLIGYFLNVKIVSDKIVAGKQFYIRRRYSSDIMAKFQDTIDELASDCANEVINAMKK